MIGWFSNIRRINLFLSAEKEKDRLTITDLIHSEQLKSADGVSRYTMLIERYYSYYANL